MTFSNEIQKRLASMREDERRRKIRMNALAWGVLDNLYDKAQEEKNKMDKMLSKQLQEE